MLRVSTAAVARGQHGHHARQRPRLGCVDRHDPGHGVRAEYEPTMQSARQNQVIREADLSRQPLGRVGASRSTAHEPEASSIKSRCHVRNPSLGVKKVPADSACHAIGSSSVPERGTDCGHGRTNAAARRAHGCDPHAPEWWPRLPFEPPSAAPQPHPSHPTCLAPPPGDLKRRGRVWPRLAGLAGAARIEDNVA